MTDFADYPWLEQAAAGARKASRRCWAKGGKADRRFPVQDIERMWPLAPIEEERPAPPLTERGKAG